MPKLQLAIQNPKPQKNGKKMVYRRSLILALTALSLAGCAVPKHHRVFDGTLPDKDNKEVRFRTTYYFRSFDYCQELNGKKNIQPDSDSLYRFRMTGKTNAYLNEMIFESGTLTAAQIDPFGATIERVPGSDALRFVPNSELSARGRRSTAISEIERLNKLVDTLHKSKLESPKKEEVTGAIGDLMKKLANNTTLLNQVNVGDTADGTSGEQNLSQLQKETEGAKKELDKVVPSEELDSAKEYLSAISSDLNRAPAAPQAYGLAAFSAEKFLEKINRISQASSADQGSQQAAQNARSKIQVVSGTLKTILKKECNENSTLNRGFQIMGPQGLQTFDQQSRLIMAMTSSGKPIISTLEKNAGRLLQSKNSGPSDAELLVAVMAEQIRVSNMERAIEGAKPENSDELLIKLIETMQLGDKSTKTQISGSGE